MNTTNQGCGDTPAKAPREQTVGEILRRKRDNLLGQVDILQKALDTASTIMLLMPVSRFLATAYEIDEINDLL